MKTKRIKLSRAADTLGGVVRVLADHVQDHANDGGKQDCAGGREHHHGDAAAVGRAAAGRRVAAALNNALVGGQGGQLLVHVAVDANALLHGVLSVRLGLGRGEAARAVLQGRSLDAQRAVDRDLGVLVVRAGVFIDSLLF